MMPREVDVRHVLLQKLRWLVLAAWFLLSACAQITHMQADQPRPKSGVIDLRGWSFAERGPVWLQGEWKRVPGHASAEQLQALNWAALPTQELPGEYTPATAAEDPYRFTLVLRVQSSEGTAGLFLLSQPDFLANANIFLLSGSSPTLVPVVSGFPNDGSSQLVKGRLPEAVLPLPEAGDEFLLVLHVHSTNSVLPVPMNIGNQAQLATMLNRIQSERYFLFGAYSLLVIVCVMIYILQQSERLYLFAAGLCLAFSLRQIGTERILFSLFPAASGTVLGPWVEAIHLFFLIGTIPIALLCLGQILRTFALSHPHLPRPQALMGIAFAVLMATFGISLYVLSVYYRRLPMQELLFLPFIPPIVRLSTYVTLGTNLILLMATLTAVWRIRSWSWPMGLGALCNGLGWAWDVTVALSGLAGQLPYINHYANLIFCFSICVMIGQRFAMTFDDNLRLLQSLKEQERARSLLFHNTSHELRTPLNGIIGFLGLIQEGRYGPIPSAVALQISKSLRLADSLKIQVNTILDLAKMKRGQLQRKVRRFSLLELRRDIDNLSEGLCLKSEDLSYSSHFEGQDHDFVSDPDHIFTILRNLLGNAFKFRDPARHNRVQLTLVVQAEGLKIDVTDTGIGILKDAEQKIFDEFIQIQDEANRRFEGSGLGLNLVKHLVQLLEGTIVLRSELGVGSTFEVYLPRLGDTALVHDAEAERETQIARARLLPLSTAAAVVKPLTQRGAGWNILVIDDHEANCEVICDSLRSDAYSVHYEVSGRAAMERMQTHRPDLVLLDLMMPDMSGEQVLQAMRGIPSLSTLPVLVITARASEDDRLHVLSLGVTDYLAKPIQIRELTLRVSNIIERLKLQRTIDIVHRTQLEEQERLHRIKTEFIANTSHELRTPLHGLLGMAEHLQARAHIGPDDRAVVEALLDNARRLARLVEDITQFQASEEGTLQIELAPLALRDLVHEAIAATDPRERHAQTMIEQDLGPECVQVDRREAVRAVQAVLANPLRFTTEGRVRIYQNILGPLIELHIEDSGPGISPEQIKRLGAVFEQGDGSATRKKGGTGLGLALAVRLMRAQGGQLTLQSQLGRGTHVILTFVAAPAGTESQPIPLQPTQPAALDSVAKPLWPMAAGDGLSPGISARGSSSPPPEKSTKIPVRPAPPLPLDHTPRRPVDSDPSPKLRGRSQRMPRILIVDDEDMNRRVIQKHLGQRFELIEASSGASALTLYETEGPFDAVLLDIMMPEMNGYEVARELRKKADAQQLPILMITAKNQAADVVEGFAAGANDYIPKPFSKAEVEARLGSHLQMARTTRAMQRFIPSEIIRLLGCEHVADIDLGIATQHRFAIIFADIQGFTSAMENLPPQEAFRWLNRCYELMGPEIRQAGGFIDKYLGDGVMALFPQSPDQALAAAVAMHQSMAQLGDIRLRIGIHFGQTMLGTLGESERFDATVLSDAVNVAARIEGCCSILGASVVVSANCKQALTVPERWQWRRLGAVRLKGRQASMELFELLDLDPQAAEKMATRETFDAALEAFQSTDYETALQLWEKLEQATPSDSVVQFFRTYCREALDSRAERTGIWELKTKS